MKNTGRASAILLSAWSAIALLSCVGCGQDGGGCPALCEEVKPKILEILPETNPAELVCSEDPWIYATSCDACLKIFSDRWDVAVTDDGNTCSKHFP